MRGGVLLLRGNGIGRCIWAGQGVPISVAATDGRIGLLRASGSLGQVRGQVPSTGYARAAARNVEPLWATDSPITSTVVDNSVAGVFRLALLLSAFELSRFVGVAPLGGLFDKRRTLARRSQARGSLGRLANIGLEPARPWSCAIMSPWRAAQTAR
jgi:hypothetical protein